jgi:hypothetical protein
MQDRDFFDVIYQQWAKTTGAENQFWASEKVAGCWNVTSVDKDDNRTPIAFGMREVDADFIAGLHGCLGDLVRFCHANLDKAEAMEVERDEAVQDQFRLAVELAELKAKYEKVEDWHGKATGGS